MLTNLACLFNKYHQLGPWQARIGRVAGNTYLYLGTFSIGKFRQHKLAPDAVGQLVGPYAKLTGCHIAGSAGSTENVNFFVLNQKTRSLVFLLNPGIHYS